MGRSDETISPADHGLNITRLVRIVFQDLPHATNRGIDAVVRVQENVLAPDSFYNLVSGHKLATLLD